MEALRESVEKSCGVEKRILPSAAGALDNLLESCFIVHRYRSFAPPPSKSSGVDFAEALRIAAEGFGVFKPSRLDF